MSIDKSLKIKGKLVRTRNVMTRAERIAQMEEKRTWKEGDPVLGLPKTKIIRVKKAAKKKEKKEAEAGAEAAAGTPGTTPAAAPAAGAGKPAAGKAAEKPADKKGGKK
ncbi:MAG: small basic protein [Planctomycetes bacterium]|jgi:small basic protein (TIGR04137 family)|nr:small basic protein [Planctomycetota bacterium]